MTTHEIGLDTPTDLLVGAVAAVEIAVEQVRRQFDGHVVEVVTDGNSGAFVTVNDVDPGPAYADDRTWLGFHISSAYPYCDVYPHFCSVVTRRDSQPHGEGLSVAAWVARPGTPALQISRRSNRWDPKFDTAAIKAVKVLSWLETR